MTFPLESRFTRGEVERTCPICGTSFIARAPRHTYCCMECRRKASGKRIGRVGDADTCPECGKRYIVRASNQTYCCERCRNKARGRRWYHEGKGREYMYERARTEEVMEYNRQKASEKRALKRMRSALGMTERGKRK